MKLFKLKFKLFTKRKRGESADSSCILDFILNLAKQLIEEQTTVMHLRKYLIYFCQHLNKLLLFYLKNAT